MPFHSSAAVCVYFFLFPLLEYKTTVRPTISGIFNLTKYSKNFSLIYKLEPTYFLQLDILATQHIKFSTHIARVTTNYS